MSYLINGNSRRNLIAVCQLNSNENMTKNLDTCKQLINRAGERNCKVIF